MAIRKSRNIYIQEDRSKMGKLLYRETPTNMTCPVGVQEWSGTQEREDGLLQR